MGQRARQRRKREEALALSLAEFTAARSDLPDRIMIFGSERDASTALGARRSLCYDRFKADRGVISEHGKI
jgi:hypothetical protein